MAEMKPLPIGVEDFKELIEKEYYFVDKTLMIKDQKSAFLLVRDVSEKR